MNVPTFWVLIIRIYQLKKYWWFVVWFWFGDFGAGEGGGSAAFAFFFFFFCFASVNYLISSPGIAISKNNPSTRSVTIWLSYSFKRKTIKIALISQILISCLISNIKWDAVSCCWSLCQLFEILVPSSLSHGFKLLRLTFFMLTQLAMFFTFLVWPNIVNILPEISSHSFTHTRYTHKLFVKNMYFTHM